MSDEINDAIEQSATDGIKQVTSDGLTVQSHSLPEQIEAAKFLGAQKALKGGKSAWAATRPARVVPPGSVGPGNTE